jgi:hypothetical protein
VTRGKGKQLDTGSESEGLANQGFILSSCMKLHLTTKANRRTAEYRTAEFRRVFPSTFDIHYSIFSFEVSCSVKLADSAASG